MTSNIVSQETLFDYSLSISGIGNEILAYQTKLNDVNTAIALNQNVIGYSSIVSDALEDLTNQKTVLEATINDLQVTLNEINDVSNLPLESKNLLYYFYTVIDDNYINVMTRIPFNYQATLTDPIIQQLLADTINTPDVKTTIAKLVYQNYPIFPNYIRSLALLYKYQSK